MTTGELTRALRTRALEAGFDAVGVAAAGPLERDGEALEAWLGRDRHAGMHWMAREPAKRADPTKLLPGCRSVVILAMNYLPDDDIVAPRGEKARVARYAQGRDYHKVLGRKLKAIAAWLQACSNAESRAFVDTGPVLERAWAEQAGLGWIGKNANLLTREMGSWFLLGEILSTAELEIDPGPHADFCGSCTACLDACPTDAIVEPGVVDSNLCISYWTIEHRGSVPQERRRGSGDWIFGCDICQEVCPWNRSFSRPADGDPFTHREDLRGLDPLSIVAMDEATFRSKYSGTPLMRAKWEGMRRNACIVLANRKRREALPTLAGVLTDPDPVLRGHAAWAVGRIGDEEAIRMLRSLAETETSPEVLAEIRPFISY